MTPLLWIHLSKSPLFLKSLIDSGSPHVRLFRVFFLYIHTYIHIYIYIYIYIYTYLFIFNALLNVYQQGYVAWNLFFLIFFIFYCVYYIHRKKNCHWWEITQWCIWTWVMAAIELHVNATYYAEHPALKSVYGKSQSVIIGKLFPTYRTVFELAQYCVFEIPKKVTWIAPMRHLSRKEHWIYVKTGYLHHFYLFYHYHWF